MDLIKIDKNENITDYFDIISNNNFMPLITLPTRITNSSKILIDNILYNQFSNDIVSGNITVGISDHIPQFAIIPMPNHNEVLKNKNIFVRKYKNLDVDQLLIDIQKIYWSFSNPANQASSNTEINKTNANEDIAKLLSNIETILNKHAPLKKISRGEYKKRNKSWITNGIIKSIRNKEKLHHNYIKQKQQN